MSPPETPFVTNAGPTNVPPTPVNWNDGSFSWFFTVAPSASESNFAVADKRTFSVSAVVCYKRALSQTGIQPDGEQAVNLFTGASTPPWTDGFLGGGYGGGTIRLVDNLTDDQRNALQNVKNNQWVMLCGWNTDTVSGNRVPVVCQWYRVVGNGVGSISPYYLSLVGPDWYTTSPNPNINGVTLVTVQGVIGVYTRTIHSITTQSGRDEERG